MAAQPQPGNYDEHSHAAAPAGDLASALEPVLRSMCEGRLGAIQWFRSTWQAGGASTGFSQYTDEQGRAMPVVVKVPVGPAEFAWTTGITARAHEMGFDDPDHLPTPHVYASGTELGGYDLAWIVVERLAGHPLNHEMGEQDVLDLLRTAARWYYLAERLRPVGAAPKSPDWESLLHKAREAVKGDYTGGHHGNPAIENAQHWNAMLKDVHRAMPRMLSIWEARPINSWCHGDLHPGNAMRRAAEAGSRAGPPTLNGQAVVVDGAVRLKGPEAPLPSRNGAGPCVLLDLALVHAGHWVEDACYLERLYWGKPELLHGVKPVTALNKFRKELGMGHGPEEDHQLLANIRRLLMAATAPAFLAKEGHPKYIRTALETVEKTLPLVVRH